VSVSQIVPVGEDDGSDYRLDKIVGEAEGVDDGTDEGLDDGKAVGNDKGAGVARGFLEGTGEIRVFIGVWAIALLILIFRDRHFPFIIFVQLPLPHLLPFRPLERPVVEAGAAAPSAGYLRAAEATTPIVPEKGDPRRTRTKRVVTGIMVRFKRCKRFPRGAFGFESSI
jgi:hypothetical protein